MTKTKGTGKDETLRSDDPSEYSLTLEEYRRQERAKAVHYVEPRRQGKDSG